MRATNRNSRLMLANTQGTSVASGDCPVHSNCRQRRRSRRHDAEHCRVLHSRWPVHRLLQQRGSPTAPPPAYVLPCSPVLCIMLPHHPRPSLSQCCRSNSACRVSCRLLPHFASDLTLLIPQVPTSISPPLQPVLRWGTLSTLMNSAARLLCPL